MLSLDEQIKMAEQIKPSTLRKILKEKNTIESKERISEKYEQTKVEIQQLEEKKLRIEEKLENLRKKQEGRLQHLRSLDKSK